MSSESCSFQSIGARSVFIQSAAKGTVQVRDPALSAYAGMMWERELHIDMLTPTKRLR